MQDKKIDRWRNLSRALVLQGDLVALEGRQPSELEPFFRAVVPTLRSWVRIPIGRLCRNANALQRLNPTLLVVDTEHFADIEQAVESLYRLRSESYKPVTILCSHLFRRHDLSLHRAAICDVSVKLPVSDQIASQLVRQAFLNNSALMQRRQDTSQQRAVAPTDRSQAS